MEEQPARQPERNPRKGLAYILLGAALFLFGGFLIVATRYGSVLGFGRPDGTTAFVLLAIGLASAVLGIRFANAGHKLRTIDADVLIADNKNRNFLYLRSFALDEEDAKHTLPVYMGLSIPVTPWESGIAAGFRGAGNLVAIGRPGEKLATPGAARVYVGDDEWQDKVLELADTADLIVWVYGSTEGLRWEVSKLVESMPPEKLVIALPIWSVPIKKRPEIWREVLASIGHVMPKGLPDDIGDSLFIAFNKDWTPVPIKARPPHIMVRAALMFGWNRITQGIRGVLDLRGITYPGPTMGTFIACTIGMLMWMTVLGVLLVLLYGLFQAFT